MLRTVLSFAGVALLSGVALAAEPGPSGTVVDRGQPGQVVSFGTLDFAACAEHEAAVGGKPPYPRVVHPPKQRVVRTPSPPPGLIRSGEPPQPGADALGGPLAPSPAPDASFDGALDNLFQIPPDTNGAVGPTHILSQVNGTSRIQGRDGAPVSSVTLDSFWSATDTFDPKTLYDGFVDRWYAVVVSDAFSPASAVRVAVSDSSNPTGTWKLWAFDADSGNLNWADYPSVGFTKDWVVVNVNMFTNSSGFFVHSKTFAISRADLLAGLASPRVKVFTDSLGFTQVPIVSFDSTLDTMFLVEHDGSSSSTGFLRMSRIVGPVGSETYTGGFAFPSTPNPWAGSGGEIAPQSGTTAKIETNDARMLSAVFRNGTIYAAHSIYLPFGTPTRSSIQWWELSTAGAILQRARIDDTAAVVFRAFPSLSVNVDEDVLIGYSRFSASTFASTAYSFRAGGDAVNTLRDEVVYKAGEATYFKDFGGGDNRWGDYSATHVDPLNDRDFWTIQEYADSPANRWATRWAKVPPVSSAGTIALDRSLYNCTQTVSVSVSDGDLKSLGSLDVTLTSGREATAETLALAESPAGSGEFSGSLVLENAVAVNGDGKLQVLGNDTVLATYHDDDAGAGSPADVSDSAPSDCVAPSVVLSAPDGGETLNAGSTSTVTWSASDAGGMGTIDLALSTAGAGGPFSDVATGIANTGSFSWSVPGPSTSNAFLRVTGRDAAGNAASDLSSSAFSIVAAFPAPSLAAVSPGTPSAISTAGGTTVTLSGSNFRAGARVKFGSRAATGGVELVPTSLSATQIQVTSPPHLGGAFDARVTNDDGQFATRTDAITFFSFSDVPASDPFFNFIEALKFQGITGGCAVIPSAQYCPGGLVTRGSMAVFIVKSLGQAPDSSGAPLFSDVPTTHPFFGFIQKFATLGITGGCGGGKFCPDATVTRGQMAVFLVKALGLPPDSSGAPLFFDVPSTHGFFGFIQKFATLGITGGCGGGNYCPDNPVTRGQMAVFLTRAFDFEIATDE